MYVHSHQIKGYIAKVKSTMIKQLSNKLFQRVSIYWNSGFRFIIMTEKLELHFYKLYFVKIFSIDWKKTILLHVNNCKKNKKQEQLLVNMYIKRSEKVWIDAYKFTRYQLAPMHALFQLSISQVFCANPLKVQVIKVSTLCQTSQYACYFC